MEAERRAQEQEKRPEKYVRMVPWFRGQENQATFLRNLLNLSALAYRIPSGPKVEERRQVIPSRQRSFSLFVLAGEGDSLDDIESGIRLREYDVTERYSRDEFRGALAHLRGISVAEVVKVVRRLTQRGEDHKLKCLLLPVQSPSDLRKDVLSSTERILQRMAAGDVKALSI
jgi:DNA-binding MarR family transcriptional regulator